MVNQPDAEISKQGPCVALLSTNFDMQYLVPELRERAPGIDIRMLNHVSGTSVESAMPSLGDLSEIDAAICWFPPHGVLAQLPNAALVQSLAAGVDHILADAAFPKSKALCRIVDPDMASGMVAYVNWAVIHRHRHMDRYLASAAVHQWREQPVVPPRKHRVGIAGLGRLGLACAQSLRGLGYTVRGWSRSAKTDLPEGMTAFSGEAQLDEFLSGCDTLICLLPLTDSTRGFLNARVFAALPKGAHLINVGRGGHLVEDDLIPALDQGQLSAATLDALLTEPLPPAHPFWHDDRIIVTPHIASRTAAAVIAEQTLRNLGLVRDGQTSPGQVDISSGY